MTDGPHCNLESRNLVLQVREPSISVYNRDENRRQFIESSLDQLLGEEDDSGNSAQRLIDLLEAKGPAFRQTPEYFAAIKDERERLRQYKELIVTAQILSGEDAEIAENPFKFLYIPEDSTMGQTRAAWIRLNRLWHPDRMAPENLEQMKMIYGDPIIPLKGKDYHSWINALGVSRDSGDLKSIQKFLTDQPIAIDAEQLEGFSEEQQEEYRIKHEAHSALKEEYEHIEADMKRIATGKVQTINKAYEAAKMRFSDRERESFAGFDWEVGQKTSKLLEEAEWYKDYPSKDWKYDFIGLEGDGQIRKRKGRHSSDTAYLTFDFGDVYSADDDYREGIGLREFFAWTELVQGRELIPMLLDDMVETYDLNHNQSEQLRVMMMNRESPNFILEALEIPHDIDEEHDGNIDVFSKGYDLASFINEAYHGPTYRFWLRVGDVVFLYRMGVEFTQNGSLILNYESQESVFEMDGWPGSTHFTPTDVKVMQAIAYGPLLQEQTVNS